MAHADLSGKYSVAGGSDQFYVTATANCATEGCTASLVSNRGWTAVATLHNNIWTYNVVKPQGAICADGNFADIVIRYAIDNNTMAGIATADSNGEWRATDVSIGPELPERRFTSIKSTDDHWEIRYERGGFVGRSYTLLLSKEVAPRVLPASTCSTAPQFECDW